MNEYMMLGAAERANESTTAGDKENTHQAKRPPAFCPKATPNSEPCAMDTDEDTYIYRNFAPLAVPGGGISNVHPQSLQAQKLPAKLATMLSDQDMSSAIVWLPHGRSWRVVSREVFAKLSLPWYFGYNSHASFVRNVNAWGFRRITRRPDRDSYFHELFLRGQPNFHQRMKRFTMCHSKTSFNKEEKRPHFTELAKTLARRSLVYVHVQVLSLPE
ncbi:hypothetical protein ACHAWF_006591 [Thalassiosira exigua]